MEEEVLYPKNYIRRFDVFAEYNRLLALNKYKYSPADAKAYGLAVAKVVAGRKFKKILHPLHQHLSKKVISSNKEDSKLWWKKFGSAKEFDKEIIERMGKDFYEKVFAPAIKKAFEEGKKYTQIRDTIREPWNKKIKVEK